MPYHCPVFITIQITIMIGLFIQFIKANLHSYTFQEPILGLFLWQIAAIAGVLSLGGAAVFLSLTLMGRMVISMVGDVPEMWVIRRRGMYLGMMGLLLYLLPELELDAHHALLSNAIWVLHLLAILLTLLLVNQLVDCSFAIVIQRKRRQYDDHLGIFQILKSIVKVISLVMTLTLAPRFFVVYDISDVITKLSIGAGTLTAIFALASKDLISNFFGALVIMVGRPFKVGDWIAVSKFEGRVIHIDIRATQLRTATGHLIYVPNGKFTNEYVKNYGDGMYTPVVLGLSLGEASYEQLTTFLAGIEEAMDKHPRLMGNRSHMEVDDIDKGTSELKLHLFFEKMEEKEKIAHVHAFIQQVKGVATEQKMSLSR